MRVTISTINKALAEAGINAKLFKAKDYFYFSGPDVEGVFEQGVYGVYRLSSLTVEQWVNEAKSKIELANNY